MNYVLIGIGIGVGYALARLTIEGIVDILLDVIRNRQPKPKKRKLKTKSNTKIPKTKHTLYTYDLNK